MSGISADFRLIHRTKIAKTLRNLEIPALSGAMSGVGMVNRPFKLAWWLGTHGVRPAGTKG